jgi:ATP-binding cassette, subfamily B (MDR/TAP), member 1
MEKPAPHVTPSYLSSSGSEENIRSKTLVDTNEKETAPSSTYAINNTDPAHGSGVNYSANPAELKALPHFHKDSGYEALSSSESEILQRQVESPEVESGYWTLFRFAGPLEWVIFCWSCICAIAAGATMPLMTVLLNYTLR